VGGKGSSTNPIVPPELSGLYLSSGKQLEKAQQAAPLADFSSREAPKQTAPLTENQLLAGGAAKNLLNPNPLYAAALQNIAKMPGGSGGVNLSDAMNYFSSNVKPDQAPDVNARMDPRFQVNPQAPTTAARPGYVPPVTAKG
jgi:hypothetical protein